MNKQINSLALLAIAGASIMSSCSKDTDLYDSNLAQKEYEQNWTEKFGQVASDQDWNTATRGSVTVTTPSSTEVKVYLVDDDTFTLVADYEGVSGTKTLEFDMPKGSSKLMVNTPSTSFMTTVGSTVDFSSATKTRSSHPGTTGGITVADADASLELSASDVFVYRDVLPEGTDNRGKVIQNFNVTSTGKDIVIYPIYWQTSQTNTVGIYYNDDNGNRVEVPVYTIKDTDNDKAKLFISKTETKWVNQIGASNTPDWLAEAVPTLKTSSSATDDLKNAIIEAVKSHYSSDNVTLNLSVYGVNNYNMSYSYDAQTWTYAKDDVDYRKAISDDYKGEVLSKGIKVTIPANTLYGFYLSTGSNIFYSEAELNPDSYFDSNNTKQDKKACHAAIYKSDDVTYLAFEDWYDFDGSSDMDLNDLVLRVDGVDPTKPEEVHNKDKETSQSWIIACEDLGSTDDYDFNDVVFEVSHVAGKNTATITPLAAGGTLKAEIYNGDTKIGEIHNLLSNGSVTATDGVYPMLNTSNAKSGYVGIVDRSNLPYTGSSVNLGVDADNFTMSNVANGGKSNMGGFWIKVYKEGSETESVTINAPTAGSVPQMLCISGDLNWAWPTERTGIEKAYTQFTDWVENTSNTEWYKTPATAE